MMSHLFKIRLFLGASALAFALPLLEAQSPSSPAKPVYAKAADNKIFAQQLVNELMAQNPDLISVGIHGIPPGGKGYVVAAHSLDLIGKKDDSVDEGIIKDDQTVIGIETIGHTTALRMVIHAGLHDRSGNVIGMVVLSFKPKADHDKLAALARAEPLLRDLFQKIPDAASLFQPSA
jgi:hypothetical protein